MIQNIVNKAISQFTLPIKILRTQINLLSPYQDFIIFKGISGGLKRYQRGSKRSQGHLRGFQGSHWRFKGSQRCFKELNGIKYVREDLGGLSGGFQGVLWVYQWVSCSFRGFLEAFQWISEDFRGSQGCFRVFIGFQWVPGAFLEFPQNSWGSQARYQGSQGASGGYLRFQEVIGGIEVNLTGFQGTPGGLMSFRWSHGYQEISTAFHDVL